MNTEYEIIEGLKAGHEEAYKYIYERQYKILCIIAKEYVDDTYSKTIKEIVTRANLKITERPLASPILKKNMAKIIITQMSRVPDMIYLMKDSYTKTLKILDNQLSTSD